LETLGAPPGGGVVVDRSLIINVNFSFDYRTGNNPPLAAQLNNEGCYSTVASVPVVSISKLELKTVHS
jgi:hypothetical protein